MGHTLVLRNHLTRAVSVGSEPVSHISDAYDSNRNANLSVSGSFSAGDILIFSIVVSLENTSKSLTVGTTATVDGNSASLVFSDSKLGLTDERYVQTFKYVFTSSTSGASIVWTGLTSSEITNAGFDIQIVKACAVIGSANSTPYDTNNFVQEADGTQTVSEVNNGYLYAFYASFDDDGRGSSWGITQPFSAQNILYIQFNEIVSCKYWTNRSSGTASFSYVEPTSEPHFLIGHLIAFEPA